MEDPIMIPILIDSNMASNEKSHDFMICMDPQMILTPNKKWFVALDSLNASYSWYNLAASYNNNILKYSHNMMEAHGLPFLIPQVTTVT